MRRSLLSSIVAVVILLPLAVFAKSFDLEYRICVRDAMNNRESRIIENTDRYHQNRLNAYLENRTRLFDAWNIENDKDRANTIRDIDKNLRTSLSSNEKEYKAVVRDLEKNFKNEEKDCRNAYNDRVKNGTATCAVSDCGPMPQYFSNPNYPCTDGTTGGPTGQCNRNNPSHACKWEVRQCERASFCGNGKCEKGEMYCGGNTPACMDKNHPDYAACNSEVQKCQRENPNPCSKDCPIP